MHFTTVAISALAASGLASASPSSNGAKRAICSKQAPSPIQFYNISSLSSPSVSFQIPSRRVGPCALVAQFPEDYPVSSSASNPRVEVFNGTGYNVGSVRFQSSNTGPTRIYINSFACQDVMRYQLRTAPEEGSSKWVAFLQTQSAGLFMEVGDSC